MTDNNGSTPVGNPAVDAGQGTQAPAVEQKWYGGFEDAELRGYAELKGWKDPAAAVGSYRNLEKMTGLPPERLAKIPDAGDTAGWSEFNKKFGWAAPEKAEEYGLPVPDGFEADFAQAMQSEFHKLGVPKDLAQKIAAASNDFTLAKMQAANAALESQNAQDLAKLKTEWGANFEGLQETGRRAIAEYAPKTGLGDDDMNAILDALGPAKFNKLWAGIGSTTGEAKFIESDSTRPVTGAMTPDAAKARLSQLGQDKEWFKRYEAGGIREKQEYATLRGIVANTANPA